MADRSLHIAIDGRELTGRPTGVGRYLAELLRRWAEHPRHRFTVVVPVEPADALRALGARLTWVVEPATVAGTWWEQMRLPGVLRRLQPDVLFAPAYTAPLRSPCPVVLVVHDVSYYAHPEWFGWREGLRRRRITRAAARRAATVLTVSEFSKAEIQRYLELPADRIVVVPHGPPKPKTTSGVVFGQKATAGLVFGTSQPKTSPGVAFLPKTTPEVVLYVGSLFTRRHVPEMIEAFAKVRASVPEARFVIVGDNRTSPPVDPREIAREAGVGDRVEWREYVDDDELERLYGEARVFLFVSDYEGFAMTPLEALAHGVPPILQDTAISREIYGDAAVRVAPEPGAIAGALTRLLTDDAAHAALLAAGRARLAAFSWDRSASLILRSLEEAVR